MKLPENIRIPLSIFTAVAVLGAVIRLWFWRNGEFICPDLRLNQGQIVVGRGLLKELFYYYICLLSCVPALMFIRWLNNRTPKAIRLTLASVSSVLLLVPAIILLDFTLNVLRYISAMGIASGRLIGVGLSLTNFALLVFLVLWLFGIPLEKFRNNRRVFPIFAISVLFPAFMASIFLFGIGIGVSKLSNPHGSDIWCVLLSLTGFVFQGFFVRWLLKRPKADDSPQKPLCPIEN